jgi:hypothetical protein
MNPNQNQLEKALAIFEQYSSGVICLLPNPSEDAVAAACGLYMGLTKAGKNVSIACATPVTSQIAGAEKISTELATAGDSLVISFPYVDGAIDKVDYYIQNDRFNIVATPRPGQEKLNHNAVQYSFTGGLVEFIVTIDTTSLKALGPLYEKHQEQLKGKPIVNVDRHLTNTFFGTANLVNRNSSSNAELVVQILQGLRVELDRDIANTLLAGIIASTANYSAPHTNAQTFEASALLMKHGAGKPKVPPQPPMQQSPQQMPQRSFVPAGYAQPTQAPAPYAQAPQGVQMAPQAATQVAPIPFTQAPPQPQIAPEPMAPGALEDYFDGDDDDEDDDWLKPSIFTPQQAPADSSGNPSNGNPNNRG